MLIRIDDKLIPLRQAGHYSNESDGNVLWINSPDSYHGLDAGWRQFDTERQCRACFEALIAALEEGRAVFDLQGWRPLDGTPLYEGDR